MEDVLSGCVKVGNEILNENEIEKLLPQVEYNNVSLLEFVFR